MGKTDPIGIMEDPAAVLARTTGRHKSRCAPIVERHTQAARSAGGDVAWFSNASVAMILDDCIGWQFLMGIWDDDG